MQSATRIAVLGGSGFIGSHVVRRLLKEYKGRAVIVIADKKPPPKDLLAVCDVRVTDLRDVENARRSVRGCDVAFLFAADMGGMGYIGANDFEIIMTNTAITTSFVQACAIEGVKLVFFASSACVYPIQLQTDALIPLSENLAWPAQPQDGYGLEKLFGEKVFEYFGTAHTCSVRIARFHNIYGPDGAWYGGREKAPAAILRKFFAIHEFELLGSPPDKVLELWGDGNQRRSFCFIDDAVDALVKLMNSTVEFPINIGSDRDVSVLELATICGNAIEKTQGFKSASVECGFSGPVGVDSRTSCNKNIESLLGWKQSTSLETGISQTATSIYQSFLALKKRVLNAHGATEWKTFVESCLHSAYFADATAVKQPVRIAMILPLTSRQDGVLDRLNGMLTSFWNTTKSVAGFEYEFYVGIDKSDKYLQQVDLVGVFHDFVPLANISVTVSKFDLPPGSICRIWRDLSLDAYRNGCDFFVMVGDDVKLETVGWPEGVVAEFESLSESKEVPIGFGCVAFKDVTFPGMPTFPVVHKLHFKIFGSLAPTVFVNQGLDPYLFQLYRAFGCSRMIANVLVSNSLGGSGDARYSKVNVKWDNTLFESIRRLEEWVIKEQPSLCRLITLDVVCPSFRSHQPTLERILKLEVPVNVSTTFIIVFDDPESPDSKACFSHLAKQYGNDPFVRLRMNSQNLGASETRNRGLDESTADWVLFLDDDVEPSKNILSAYAKAIEALPNASGFVGPTILPPPKTSRQIGVSLANMTFFWDLGLTHPGETKIPWGVTANLVARRTDIRFKTLFPKTGGGEDVDFCLRTTALLKSGTQFVAVPDALANHPWWDGGTPKYSHFWGWARGDGALADLFPQYAYYNLPTASETIFLSSIWYLMNVWIYCWGYRLTVKGMFLPLKIGVICVLVDFCCDLGITTPTLNSMSWKLIAMGRFEGFGIKLASEFGRMFGQWERGTLMRNLFKRFNWLGDMWIDAVCVERQRMIVVWAIKVVALALIYWFI
ncbi:hypothetical protein HDU79_001886 [Rhizoclosmatium sp. JEL0117]|nr:hypothetical protein HDU79_001886 [Rhizoclosmatium sp. JEL0117]